MIRIRGGLLAGACAVAACALGTSALAATYKWTDEKGVVHYTDKIPPEAVDRANVQMNKEGLPVRKMDQALTPEQRRAKEQEEERRKAGAKQQEEVARRDRALLASYTSDAEIDLARARALNTIDAVMQSSKSYSEQLERRKADINQKAAPYRANNKPVPVVYDREIENINQELARQTELMEAKRKEMAAVQAKYDADKARYQALKAAAADNARSSSMTSK